MAHITKEELRMAVQAGYARGMVDGFCAGVDQVSAALLPGMAQGCDTTLRILREDKSDAIQKLIAYRDSRSKK